MPKFVSHVIMAPLMHFGATADEEPYSSERPSRSTAGSPSGAWSPNQDWQYELDMDMWLPSSAEVQNFVAGRGPTVTFLGVALAILDRLEAETDSLERKEEFNFLRNCLQKGRDKTLMTCGLSTDRRCTETSSNRPLASPGKVRVSSISGDSQPKAVGRRASQDTEIRKFHSVKTFVPPVVDDEVFNEDGVEPVRSIHPPKPGSELRGALTYMHLPEAHLKSCPWMGPAVPRWPTDKLSGCDVDQLQDCLRSFSSWTFNIFDLAKLTNGRPLQFAGWHAMCCSGCFSEFAVEPDRVRAFLQAAEPLYLSDQAAPYHNNIHAADVVQTVHAMLMEVGISQYFDPMDTMAAIVSAIVHDMGHDGRNNAFHVNAQDDIAITYNDKSVLENYHLALAFRLLVGSSPTNFLYGWSREQSATIRKEIIEMVLGTDMSQHFHSIGDFIDMVSNMGRVPVNWQSDTRAIYALRGMVLHAADISNATKPSTVSQKWSARCMAEFFSQGDEEKRMGLPVSPLCDRATTAIPQSQVGFIKFIVQPTYEALASLMPQVKQICLVPAARNLAAWEQLQKEETMSL